MAIGLILLFVTGAAGAQHTCGHGHNNPCTTIAPGEVNQAIVDLHLFYNDDLCLELLLIDCATHVTQGDEVLCASNGKTYDNHCHFIHARCELYLIGHASQLTKVHSGACGATTMPPAATTSVAHLAVSTTMAAVSGMTTTTAPAMTASTVTQMAGSMATGMSTMAPTTSTTDVPTIATTMASTTTGVNDLIHQLFCKNVDTFSCSHDFTIVCGSDGQFYPNSCELSKAKCKNPTLTSVSDSTKCSLPGK